MPAGFENSGLQATLFIQTKDLCESFEWFNPRLSTGRVHLNLYHFGVKNGKFIGLALDKENQQDLTDDRLKKWVEMLKKEFI
jgi:hypothetical protein